MQNTSNTHSGGNAPDTGPASPARKRAEACVAELLADRESNQPIWIRSPKSGPEHFTGFSRAKLYEGAGKGFWRSVSIRQPGQTRGTRLFNLPSILSFIEKCEAEANAAAAAKEGLAR